MEIYIIMRFQSVEERSNSMNRQPQGQGVSFDGSLDASILSAMMSMDGVVPVILTITSVINIFFELLG